jgi:hypothetical protein
VPRVIKKFSLSITLKSNPGVVGSGVLVSMLGVPTPWLFQVLPPGILIPLK